MRSRLRLVAAVALASALAGNTPAVHATEMVSATGTVSATRVYADGTSGVRLQMTVATATHNCGTDSVTYYFDSSKIGLEAVKAIIALAVTALAADKPIQVTYDCSLASGGYGWGVALEDAH